MMKQDTKKYRHLKYLMFWPVYLMSFAVLERVFVHDYYHPVHCFIDDLIPFCEYFLIPYCLWFVELLAIQLYTLLYDIDEFKNFIKYLTISFMGTLLIYIIYPTCQEMRVEEYARSNIFTYLVQLIYSVDTNTNVCPSLHVIGAVAVMISTFRAKGLNKPLIRVGIAVLTILISMSTVFLKQHSFVDVICAIPVCLITYMIIYRSYLF
ncbi:MAG: phosphatase PAP2 family protein [Eubacteriales bacterium]|nr:phosphatase PAP2 family protein [Eubacteriales bacterium]